MWTVGSMIRWCEEYFRSKGIQTGRLDAELLLAHVLGCSRVRLYIDWNKVLEKPELALVRESVLRRRSHEPVAYIIGEKEFWSLKFRVDRRVLVPRPETELLVEEALKIINERGLAAPSVAEIGTGSGNIACALANSISEVTIIATDSSPDVLQLAQENAARLGLSEKITFLQGDLAAPLHPCGAFDMLVSNPPYVSAAQWEELAPEVRRYEPRGALLAGGAEGEAVIARLVKEGVGVLKPEGVLLCEIGAAQGEAAAALARGAGFRKSEVKNDYAGLPRVLVAEK